MALIASGAEITFPLDPHISSMEGYPRKRSLMHADRVFWIAAVLASPSVVRPHPCPAVRYGDANHGDPRPRGP